MKKIIYSLLLVAFAGSFTACHEITTEDTSTITYYAVIDLEGGATYLNAVGEPFVDPGYTATEGTEDVTANVEVDYSVVDSDNMGLYSLTYSVVNQDGFPSYAYRDVIVYNEAYAGPNVAGTYTLQPGSYRDYGDGYAITAYSGYSVTVTETAPGFFYISDYFGGYYDQGVGYGSSYAMTGYFTLNDDNTIEPISSYLSGWGDGIDYMVNGYYDQAAGTIYWEVSYAACMVFYVTLAI